MYLTYIFLLGSMCSVPGALVNVTQLVMPLARSTLPPQAFLQGSYIWTTFSPVALTGTVTLTVTSDKGVLCSESVNLVTPQPTPSPTAQPTPAPTRAPTPAPTFSP